MMGKLLALLLVLLPAPRTAPVPGGGGGLRITSPNISSVTVSWALASSADPILSYEVLQGKSAMTTINAAEANGKVIKTFTLNLSTFTVKNLLTTDTPYFAVIVKDSSGTKALYPSVQAKYEWYKR